MKRKDIKLNSFLLGFIKLILISAPIFLMMKVINFVFVSLILFICMIALRIENKKQFFGRYVAKVFGIGLISDVIGWIAFSVSLAVFDVVVVEKIVGIPAFIISVAVVFLLNYFVSFKNIRNEEKELQAVKKSGNKARIILSLIFTIVTAPWQIIIPFGRFYMFLWR